MSDIKLLDLFQGLATLMEADSGLFWGRIVLIFLGLFLFYLGYKGILEGLIMVPMGLGMATINAAVLFLSMDHSITGTLFLDPLISETDALMNILQIDWLQPVYTFTFSNGLIACTVFMGIGAITDVGYVLANPFSSMTIALCAELGTVVTLPLAVALGLPINEAAAIALVGGADGPMVLFSSLILARDLFVPITIVAYLYLGLTYAGYPYMIKFLIPKRLRSIKMDLSTLPNVEPAEKVAFSVICCVMLCFLFPVAAPLFFSFFLGTIVKDAGLKRYTEFCEGPLLFGSTLFLGLVLGILCEASTILDPKVLLLLILGITALFFSGIGGIIGGYIMYFVSGGKFNPVVGIAGVSCVPTTAKVAQKTVNKDNPSAIVMPFAIGASVCGVITTAILTGIYVTLVPLIQ